MPPRLVVWLDNARIVAVAAAVLLHVAGAVSMEHPVGSAAWWAGTFYDAACRWSVPVFVMISGAMLLDPNKCEDLPTFYRKRLARVLWPLLFWSAFFLGWTALREIMRGATPDGAALAAALFSGIPYYHLWYMYMLLGLYLFTPFLRKVVTHSTHGELALLTGALFALAAVEQGYITLTGAALQPFILWFRLFLPYFLLGHLVRRSAVRPPVAYLVAIFGLALVGTIVGCYVMARSGAPAMNLYFDSHLGVTVIPLSVSAAYLLKRWTTPLLGPAQTARWAPLSFGVYLMHPIVWDPLNDRNIATDWFNPLLSIPVTAAVVFALAAVGTWLFSRVPYLRRTV